MSQRIAGLYEIIRKIGSGGGGIVYLGWHMRLEKYIVLKADRRTLDTKPEKLRREVDMLKNLSYPYIPQVYDFVQEDGIVYTVMEFIEGESLDKLLKRGEYPSQPQVIQWACQLLKALDYLHSRPPYGILHGDIKPANIMLRPNGDICLIDFNIALVLGENGAVKVGRSRGYASPEHYGLTYVPEHSPGQRNETKNRTRLRKRRHRHREPGAENTELMEMTETMPETQTMPGTESMEASRPLYSERSSSLAGSQQRVTLDARSDIYSLGATLYHLLSGNRPNPDALEVEPLGEDVCSPQVADIIRKAMNPSSQMRYQRAEEMLDAFRQLYLNDIRTIQHRRRTAVSAAVFVTLFLAGGACTFIGLSQMKQVQESLALAEYSANSLAKGDVSEAVDLALQALSMEKGIFSVPAAAPVQKALSDALGVYDLSDGFKALDALEIPSAPFSLVSSPEGSRFAVTYAFEAAVIDAETGERLAVLPLEKSALADIVFLDEHTVIYAGDKGVSVYDLEQNTVRWTGETATALAVSGDRRVAAAVNRKQEYAVLYRTADGEKIGECSFQGRQMPVAENDIYADPGNSIFALNNDGSMLAVSFADGGLMVFDWKNPESDLFLYDESEYTGFAGGFCGKYFAFVANQSGKSQFGIVDTEKAVYLGGQESQDEYVLQADEEGIALANGNLLVRFAPDTLEETELAYTDQRRITGFSLGEEYILTTTDAPGFAFFDRGAKEMLRETSSEGYDFTVLAGKYAVLGSRNSPSLRMLQWINHEDARLLSYDARYVHDEARISQDRKTAMLFSYQSFRVYDMEGNMLAEVELPEAEKIYDQQFRRKENNSWLEVIWYDGTVRCYRAEDGEMISETAGEPPDASLKEEFYTDRYRIVSSLHDAPEVYDRKTNRKIAELEKDAYLTYVTQAGEGEYIITEYISAEGKRYGLVLDKELQTVACVPELCDMVGEMLIVDDKSGNLRQCRLYSLQELKELGEMYRKK